MFKFNVGTAVDGVDNALAAQDVFNVLVSQGFLGVRLVAIKPSNTETTLILEADGLRPARRSPAGCWGHKAAVYCAARALGQDCIAYKMNDTGYLVGPKAEDWGGEFNPEYFLE